MLELVSVRRHFGPLKVIDDLDLSVAKGDVLGILGPNGAGKTTLFNVILGVHPVSAGHVRFEGRDITRKRPWSRCQMGIGRTYQVPKPFSHMSVFENVLVAAVSGGQGSIRASRDWAVEVVELTGLAHRMERPAGELSLLDLKRLELAKAVACRPKLLLLDEIAGGLTDMECDELLEIIRGVHRQGATIVWIEHVIHALRRAATRLAVLYGGKIISSGTPDAVLADPRVREVYLGVEA
ncbi:amino acid/amide ABC transporter ATP-binding protein 1, HAAT family [Faunimonas pinastri]|uniref:Amino acid/amide ABC transporter ATP-binding protein 1, HAAT family n=1 Tax=Faunimonas pinastri TaxID=1855383 RepID=A0A1H9K706_9HYPH|nr:ABC transporter ATP-binding protein [Faunimonas pinastri]SEQ94645.1 amino acid/amide ABC transporter ATP-binding protein 1, HAAT family [Faunimonas pinastri]